MIDLTNASRSLELLPVSKLIVDPEPQRVLDKTWVSRHVAVFDESKLGTWEVSRRADGLLHIMDGQHRQSLCLAVCLSDRVQSCGVWTGLTRAQEAELFGGLNDRRSVKPLDSFRIRVIAEDPVAVSLNRVINENGWHVADSGKDGYFRSTVALEKIYSGARIYGAQSENLIVCANVLKIVTAAWGHNYLGVSAQIIMGLGMVLLRNNSIDFAKLHTVLSKTPPLTLVADGQQVRSLYGGSVSDGVAEVIVSRYNSKRHAANRLPAWRQ